MAETSTLLISLAGHREGNNALFAAMGWGPNTFSQPLLTAESVDTDPPAAWHGHGIMPPEQAAITVAMMGGTLPVIPDTWGENGIISEADALEAMEGLYVGTITMAELPAGIADEHKAAVLPLRGLKGYPPIEI